MQFKNTLQNFKKMSNGEKIIFSGYFISLITIFVITITFSLKNSIDFLHKDVYVFSKKLDALYFKTVQIEKNLKK